MSEVSDINRTLRQDLKITEKTLVYPHNLRDLINSSSESDPVAFVKFTPKSPKITVPRLTEKPLDPSTVETGQDDQIEIIEQSIAVDAVFLPIRPVQDDLSGNWQSIEGMGLGNLGAYLKWKMYKSLSGVASTVLPQEAVYAMKTGVFGGGIDNPHDRLAFGGHQRRTFNIAWEFLKPVNRSEEQTLIQIASLFRMGTLGGYGAYVIAPPMYWEVSFSSFPSYKNFLRYGRVGFQSCSITFGGDDDFHAMESGMPFLQMSLACSELDYPVRGDVSITPDKNLISDFSELQRRREQLVEQLQKENDAEKELVNGKS